MANPRQRNKARSSKSTKPSLAAKRRMHHKLRKPPTLSGPEVLQSGWDKHKTVFQNYKALGLLPSLPLPTASGSRSYRTRLTLPPGAIGSASGPVDNVNGLGGAVFSGFGQIIRDEEGNVVDIIIPEEQEQDQTPPEQEADDAEEGEERNRVEAQTDVVRSLEQLAASSVPVKRHSSTSERTWLQDLVRAHGSNYEAMARDHKLNVWQKTQGEIKRMVNKAGGVDKLTR
ncbi:ribosome biogenesis protein Nop16 [Kockovaella imperatae]|uniref:Nucleolar protein 16 n=1 Tax=Kockovaella imperatae TaxID=4999 RepID=A0A1Y1UKX6_9TREE|nr:ribosome biogenesis protein Nop16 [Kockovaella imperatae]ORX38708.1 ribosome biogenesis protein Nop16 [Kockovaella imperatae]